MYDVLQFDACGEIVLTATLKLPPFTLQTHCIARLPFPEGIPISDGMHESIDAMSGPMYRSWYLKMVLIAVAKAI